MLAAGRCFTSVKHTKQEKNYKYDLHVWSHGGRQLSLVTFCIKTSVQTDVQKENFHEHVAVLEGEVCACVCGVHRTVRAIRALNRWRLMEIKTQRLANGNIMGPDGPAQLGHANEAASAGRGGRIDTHGQSAGRRRRCSTDMYPRTE